MSELSGTYISMSGVKLPFDICMITPRYMVLLDGRSKGIAGATSERAPGWKGAVGTAFSVTTDEYEHFVANVIDKNVEWVLGDGVLVPGVWTSCASPII
jgi:hypothetical protein